MGSHSLSAVPRERSRFGCLAWGVSQESLDELCREPTLTAMSVANVPVGYRIGAMPLPNWVKLYCVEHPGSIQESLTVTEWLMNLLEAEDGIYGYRWTHADLVDVGHGVFP